MNRNPYRLTGTKLIPAIVLLFSTFVVFSQEAKVVRDLHLWSGIYVEKTVARDWTFSLGQEFRFKHDISEINNYFTEAGLRYRINRNFALQTNYRFTRDKNKDNSYENLSRYNFDLRYKGKLDFLTTG